MMNTKWQNRNERERTRHGFGVGLALAAALLGSACSDDGKGDSSGHAACQALCEKQQSCPNDDTDVCLAECDQLSAQCPTEAKAANDCTLARPASDFRCDDSGRSRLKDGICEGESSAVIECALGGLGASSSETLPSAAPSATNAGASASASTSSSSAPPPSASASGMVPEGEVAELCAGYCASLATLECPQTAEDCETQCSSTFATSPACSTQFKQLADCTFGDAANNFTCGDTGKPVLKEGVCAEETSLYQGCLLNVTDACAEFCAESATPPVTCASDPVDQCRTNCSLFTTLGGDPCVQAYQTYTLCVNARDAAEWSCEEDIPTYGGSGCATESSDLATLCLGF